MLLIARVLRSVARVYDTPGCVCLARAARIARVGIARVKCLQLIIHKKNFFFFSPHIKFICNFDEFLIKVCDGKLVILIIRVK